MKKVEFKYIPQTDEEIAAFGVINKLIENGHQAFIVGGAVRDKVIEGSGCKPHDVDVATNATTERVIEIFDKTIPVGISFGVVRVMLNGIETEVATFRKDEGYTDGRRPDSVNFADADIESDAARRDLTINALFYDIANEEIIDFFNGIDDLNFRIIRTVGDPEQRFAEDKLRMIRAIRFTSRFENFRLEEKTRLAIVKHAAEIKQVSAERIFDELTKTMLSSVDPTKSLDLLMDTGLLKHVLPEIALFPTVEQSPDYHPEGHLWNHVKLMFSKALRDCPEICWAILLHDVGKRETHEFNPETGHRSFNGHGALGMEKSIDILRGLKCSTVFVDTVSWLVKKHMDMMQVNKMKRSNLRRLLGDPRIDLLIRLHELDCLSSTGGIGNSQFLRDKQEEFANEPVLPDPLAGGHDVMDRGIKPGSLIGSLLGELRELQLNDEITDREEALRWLDTNCPIALAKSESQ